MFSEEKFPQQEGKKQQSIGIKFFYWNAFYSFEYKKNSISKLSIKMFVKSKTRAGKTYDYRILLSFKTSKTYKNNF